MEKLLPLTTVPNAADRADIIELQQKVDSFRRMEMDEDRFKHFRLTRGVYGQRQLGVHMFRTKIPLGRLTSEQLIRLADTSEKFTNGNVHLTTRQNIQYHYVKLEDSPAIWKDLAEVGVNAREACGNTVRNLTASATAGIDPHEPFDVGPYAMQVYDHFLRNPVCQDMGRKIKIAFSSSQYDTAFAYIHDFGMIPKTRERNGQLEHGFKVLVGGGLGAQAMAAQTAFEFLPVNELIPFMEAAIRLFDRYGEREKRFKARMKFFLKQVGLEKFLQLVDEERVALGFSEVPIEYPEEVIPQLAVRQEIEKPVDLQRFGLWKATNVFEQRQKGLFAVQVRVPRGDIIAATARKLASLVTRFFADDIRITMNQGFLLRFAREEDLPGIFNALDDIGLARAGFGSLADVTSCPGTDTCNLAVSNSTALSDEIEQFVIDEYEDLVREADIQIKISGCMNSCGQHMAAQIGFHGSSIKMNTQVLPAMQVVLGGGVDRFGRGLIAQKIIKLPTRRVPDAIRTILDDFIEHRGEHDFNRYFYSHDKRYFYDLLKPLADAQLIVDLDYIDWGGIKQYKQAIGVGECAGVSYDLVSTIIGDAVEKVELAGLSKQDQGFSSSIYHSYSAFVVGAKALLLSKDIKCNTHLGIINDFQTEFVDSGLFSFQGSFSEYVLGIKKQAPSERFANAFHERAKAFVDRVSDIRQEQLSKDQEAPVVNAYYKA